MNVSVREKDVPVEFIIVPVTNVLAILRMDITKEGGIRLAYSLPGREYLVRMDASNIGISTVLLQRTKDRDELPIRYNHRILRTKLRRD